jgi:PAS domain S-box-containing protein
MTPKKRNGRSLLETNERLQVLQQVTEAVHSTLDSEDVFKRITDGAVSSLGYTIAFVAVLNSKKKCFEIKALSAKKQPLSQIEKALGFSLSRLSVPAESEFSAAIRSVLEGRVAVVKTLAEIAYPVISKEVCSALQKLGGGKNYIVVPLQTKGGVVGGIFVSSPREEVPEEELTMLQNFAGAASQAIRNASLYTRAKPAPEALRQGEENLKTYLENAPDGVYLNDLKGTFLYGNKRAEEILGYEREELIGKSFLELNILPAKYLAKAGKLLALNATGRPTGPDEFELTRKDGSPTWVEISTAPIEQGGETVVIGFVRDITERKQVEELYTTLANSSPASIYIGQDNKFIYVNPAFQEASGYTKDELLGRDLSTIVHLNDREKVRQHVVQMLKGKRLQPYEFRFITKSGETGWALERVAPITYEGRPAILGVCINITEHKQAEEALRQSDEKYAALVEKGNDGIIIIQDGVLKFVNSKMLEVTGFSMNETLGRAFLDFVSPESRGLVADRYSRRIAGESVSDRYEIEILSRDGEKIPVEISASIIEYEGRPADMAIIRDISERRKAEEALKLQKAYFQQLFDNSPDAIVMLDDTDRVVQVNKGFETLFGYPVEEIKGRFINELIIPENRIEEALALSRAALNGEAVREETVRKRKDGSLVNVSALGYPIHFGDKLVGVYVIYSDITERKQAEELYTTLANSPPVGIYIIQDGKYVFANPTLQKTTGYTADELLAMPPAALVHPEDVESTGQKQVQMLKGKTFQPYEFRFITKSGETGWSLERVASTTYQGRRAVLGVSINITEHKQAEQLYHTLADSSPVGVYIVQDKKFVFTNPAFQEALGYTTDELLGRHSLRRIHPEDQEKVRQNAVQMLKGQRLYPYEFRYITKSGETRWALERVTSITYQGRRAALGNFLDVTESKQAQERIERAAEEWRTTFDSITDFISIHDKDNRIVRMNKALANAFKTTPKELIGKVCHEVMHGTEEPPANCPYRQTLRTGKPATMEMFEPTLGIWLQESTSPIFDEKGEVAGSVHIVRDVSERKRMEEQLVMTDRLASIGELASGIAHELNNPLTSVIGFSQLLMEGNVPDNIKEDLGTVYSEAQRAAAVVKNLLTFARKHAPVKQLSQVNAIIEDVLRLRAYEHKVNNIEVDKRLATDLPEIMADNFQMQQVFLNIIVNAEFAMLEAHGKGKLVITTERVNSIIKVTFTDDGPGISKENMKRIFQPFFTTKEAGKGTGLGLSICLGIVTGHGGRIYARSEVGRGATFVVELPLNGN